MKRLTRRERVELLLEHWVDFFETSSRDDGPEGQGGVYLLPGMSRHPSVVELGRCIGVLRGRAPVATAHLMAFYTAPFKVKWSRRKVMGPQGRLVLSEPVAERVRLVPSWVRRRKVSRSVDLLCELFVGDVFLPDQISPWRREPDGERKEAA